MNAITSYLEDWWMSEIPLDSDYEEKEEEMNKNVLTVVIKYEEDQEQPAFHANMECLGGKVTGVMFDDALERLEEAEQEIQVMGERD